MNINEEELRLEEAFSAWVRLAASDTTFYDWTGGELVEETLPVWAYKEIAAQLGVALNDLGQHAKKFYWQRRLAFLLKKRLG